MEIPLKLKYRTGKKSRYKSVSSNSGINRHRGETDKNRREFAFSQTMKYRKVMLVLPNGKTRFVLASSLNM